jgi:hypothetical protein
MYLHLVGFGLAYFGIVLGDVRVGMVVAASKRWLFGSRVSVVL